MDCRAPDLAAAASSYLGGQCAVRRCAHGGLGVFATRPIAAGTRIVVERPLVLTPLAATRLHTCAVCLADSRRSGEAEWAWLARDAAGRDECIAVVLNLTLEVQHHAHLSSVRLALLLLLSTPHGATAEDDGTIKIPIQACICFVDSSIGDCTVRLLAERIVGCATTLMCHHRGEWSFPILSSWSDLQGILNR